MRDAFESGELNCVVGIDGKNNLADEMIKVNHKLSGRLNEILSAGNRDVNLEALWCI